MARISEALRKKTETLPGGRYPMPDARHARLALQMLNRGKLSSDQKIEVKARAERMLGK